MDDTHCKISAATLARTAVLALALTNQVLSVCGKPMLPIENDTVEQLRAHFGKAVTITSGYRTAAHNAAVGGAKSSQHLLGRAADIRVEGVSVEDVAAYTESLMPDWGSVGRYPVKAGRATGWVHVDTRAEKARWRG